MEQLVKLFQTYSLNENQYININLYKYININHIKVNIIDKIDKNLHENNKKSKFYAIISVVEV